MDIQDKDELSLDRIESFFKVFTENEGVIADKLFANLFYEFSAPRDLECVKEFLYKSLPAGKVFICGAGTHTSGILESIERRNDIKIVGIIDRYAAKIKEFCGYKVYSAKEIEELKYDLIMISHQECEIDMINDLKTVNISKDKIFRIYTNKNFKAFSLNNYINPAYDKIKKLNNIKCIIISTEEDRNCILNDEDLSRLFGPDTTLKLDLSYKHIFTPSKLFPTIDLKQSVSLLEKVIKALRPEVIYLQTYLRSKNQHLPVLIKRLFPQIKLIHALGDLALIFEDSAMMNWLYTPETIWNMRNGEIFSSKYADLIIHKNGGSMWDKIAQNFKTRQTMCFPSLIHEESTNILNDEYSEKLEKKDNWKILYAGYLPVQSVQKEKHNPTSYYDAISIFEKFLKFDYFKFEIYNASHLSNSMDIMFYHYINNYSKGNIIYNRAIPLETLLEKMKSFDFGWLVINIPNNNPSLLEKVIIQNKFVGYVFGKLPIIISRELEFMASFIEKFNAGIIIDSDEVDNLPEIIKNLNYPCLKKGIKNLHQFILKNTETTIEILKEICLSNYQAVNDSWENRLH